MSAAPDRPRGDYGFDAPLVPAGFAAASLVALVLGLLALGGGKAGYAALWLGTCAWFALSAASFVFTTRRGKLIVWSELLDGLGLRGDERLLDMGCGRGAVLLQAAARLPRGRAVGVDLWSTRDQSGNAPAVTRANAAREGVRERVALLTADMRALPFPDACFDVVLSSLAVHNIPDAAGRTRAMDELLRVLRPGGRALVADLGYTRAYARRLEQRGARVERRGLGWRFWYGGPHAATSLVRVEAPAAP